LQYLSNGLTDRWEIWHDGKADPMNFTLPYTSLTILRNKTAKIKKNKNWFQFLSFVKAAVLKRQISKLYPKMLRVEAIFMRGR